MCRVFQLLVVLSALSACRGICGQESKPPDALNRIIRVKPSETAAKIGTAVQWEPTWDSALQKSHSSGKPIFWYIGTIPQTFMDRKVEIDRYMLAGPFSWPATIERLNRDFIPYRAAPSKEQIEAYDLKPYKFVEPGFLIVGKDQKVSLRVDRVTTLHPLWFDRLVAQASPAAAKQKDIDDPARAELDRAWRQLGEPAWPSEGRQMMLPAPGVNDVFAAEKMLLKGMLAFRSGDHAGAKEAWTNAAKVQPDSPVAWKAAAEAEGFGPFVRGFEVFTPLSDKALRAGIDSIGSAAPSGTYDESELWRRGVDFLLGMQSSDGGVFDSDYDFGGFDSLANVHCAVTALVGLALLDALPRLPEDRREAIRAAITKAAEFVSDDQHINTQDRDEILWAQAYRIRFLSKLVTEKFGDVARHRASLEHAVNGLEQIQLERGGWQHEYANPFVTGTALAALHAADQAGVAIDSQKVQRGLASLGRDRFASGAYPYSSRGGQAPGRDSIEASAGRIPVCEMALWLWQKLTDEQLEQAARVSLDNHKYLNIAYKYDNHTSTMAYGGFFFWYDMHARAELISKIKDEGTRHSLSAEHRKLIMELPELDGCFVDSHELGRCYGTAMALLSLAQLE